MVVLYRKYRPQKLSDLVGQEHIKNALLTSFSTGKISHAYLFAGPKGTGKTTTARIIAKMLNCEKNPKTSDLKPETYGEPCNKCDACVAISNGSFLDVLEIDAASNRLIDDVRDLREKIKLAPTFGRYKVYILDEVHMLTTEAFNALLKTLEEPPEHTVFILCTTAAFKLPQTIISRCQRFDFKKATDADIVVYLNHIAKEEKIDTDKKTLQLIAQQASGGYRDAVSIFDQLVSSSSKNKLTEENVRGLIVGSEENDVIEFIKLLGQKKLLALMTFIKVKTAEGISWPVFLRSLLNLLETYLWQQISEDKNAANLTILDLKKLIGLFIEAEKETKFAIVPQLPSELAVIEWCEEQITDNSEQKTEGNDGKKNDSNYSSNEAKFDLVSEKSKDSSLPIKSGSNNKDEEVNSSLTLEDFQKQWQVILKTVKPYNYSVEALLRGCEPQSFDGNVLNLTTYYKFHKDRISDIKVKNLIEKVLRELFGYQIRITCLLSEKTKKQSSSQDLSEVAEEIFQ